MLKKQENCGMLIKNTERNGFEVEKQKCSGCQRSTCNGCRLFWQEKLHTDKEQLEQTGRRNKVTGSMQPGIAFDVGTTTVAATLWDLETGACLSASSCMNPQRKRGSDVVSRIAYCMKEETRIAELQKLVTDAMEKLVVQLLGEHAEKQEIKRAVVVGNPAMCQLVLGYDVSNLAAAPFCKGYSGFVSVTGDEIGLEILRDTEIIVMPSVEGYVGADALAVYSYARSKGAKQNCLIIDIGTNGEIIFIGKEKIYACSAAAGPALEGAAAECGMPALPGAISGIRQIGMYHNIDFVLDIIGDGTAKGICGSGLIDGMAFLYRQKVLAKDGYLKSPEEAAKDGTGVRICNHLKTVDGENRFYLSKENDIYISGKDIRQLQLAKGAVRAGIELLLQKEGITVKGIERIYLAGAFGNDIDVKSAVEIGLLPEGSKEKIVPVGNGAGFGAAMALLSESCRKEMADMSEKIIHIEIAKETNFEELFMSFIDFPG